LSLDEFTFGDSFFTYKSGRFEEIDALDAFPADIFRFGLALDQTIVEKIETLGAIRVSGYNYLST